MSFKLNWPSFSPEFMEKAKQQLTTALNKGEKPEKIAGQIVVHELNMGTKPPDLEILEIGELQEDRFRGIFKMGYNGDAYLELMTSVQANPLKAPKAGLKINENRGPSVLAANWPLVVPMRLKISNLLLRGIIVLVVDKHKGVTLVFKNDPLEKVDVNSTFDNIPNIRRFLQSQIETLLRKMFQEDLPALIHNLSLVYLSQKNNAPETSGFASHSSGYPDRSGNHKDEDLLSLDSGYHGDDSFVTTPTLTRAFNHDQTRQHRQKWVGNDVSDDDDDDAWVHGYYFYRNLSVSCGATDMGLRNLFVPGLSIGALAVTRVQLWEKYGSEGDSTLVDSRSLYNSHDGRPPLFRQASISSHDTASTRFTASTNHTMRAAASNPAESVRAGYAGYQNLSTRPRIPLRAMSSMSLNTDFGTDWASDFHGGGDDRNCGHDRKYGLTLNLPNSRQKHCQVSPMTDPSYLAYDEDDSRHQVHHNGAFISPDDGAHSDFGDDAHFDTLSAFSDPGTSPTSHQHPHLPVITAIPAGIVLRPTDNPRAAHLANLMSSNLTLTPHTQSEDISHLAFRAHPIRFPFSKGKRRAQDASSQPAAVKDKLKAAEHHSRPIAMSRTASHGSTTVVAGTEPTSIATSPPPLAYLNGFPSNSTSPASNYTNSTRSWRTRNVIKLKLPPGVNIPQGLLSPGLDQRMAEMGYRGAQSLDVYPNAAHTVSDTTSSGTHRSHRRPEDRKKRRKGVRSVKSEGASVGQPVLTKRRSKSLTRSDLGPRGTDHNPHPASVIPPDLPASPHSAHTSAVKGSINGQYFPTPTSPPLAPRKSETNLGHSSNKTSHQHDAMLHSQRRVSGMKDQVA